MKRTKLTLILIGWLISIITNLTYAIYYNSCFWGIVVILTLIMIYDIICHYRKFN